MINDFKLIFRNPSLRTFLFVPIIIFLFILVGVPMLVARYEVVMDFVPIILMGGLLQSSTMFGFIYSMVFIEEKELQVNSVYGVAPFAKWPFVVGRLLTPTLLSLVFTFALMALQPFYAIHWTNNLLFSFLAALIMPLMALLTATFSKNKIEGMTWYKIFNLLVNVPLLAYFLPEAYAHLLGIIPTHWIFWSFHEWITGLRFSWALIPALVYLLVLIAGLSRYFAQRHYAN